MKEMESREPSPGRSEAMGLNRGAGILETVDIKFLAGVLWRKKWIILLCVALGLLKGLHDVRGFQPQYTAKMVVAPVEGSQAGLPLGRRATSALQNFGINLGSGAVQTSPFDRLVFQLSSVEFARHLQAKYGLMQKLFAGKWIEAEKKWKKPGGTQFMLRNKLRKFMRLNVWSEPRIEDLARYIGGNVAIVKDPITGFANISYRNVDPKFALYLLETVYREADERVRQFERAKIEDSGNYIEKQLEKQSQNDLRTVLFSLLGQQQRKKMLLSMQGAYVAPVLEPLHLVERQTEPEFSLMLTIPMLVGFLASSLLILLITLFREG
jgi:hypothetical protein